MVSGQFPPLSCPFPFPHRHCMLSSTILALALLVSSSVAALPPVRRDPIHIPVFPRSVRHDDRNGDLARHFAAAEHTRKKYGYAYGTSSPSRRASITDIDLTDYVRPVPYIQLTFGFLLYIQTQGHRLILPCPS